MKQFKRIVLGTFLTSIIVLCVAASTREGTSVLHYMTRNSLTASEASSNVTASLRLQLNEQGNSAHQKFDLNAAHLQARTEYILIAALGDDTNVSQIGTATTDSHGRLSLSYKKNGNGQGNGKKALPVLLDPVTRILGLGLQDSLGQTVAFAWVNTSSQYQYLVKRNLTPADTNETAAGSISLKANGQNVNFRLLANGLSVSNTYHLALNSIVVATTTADARGELQINTWPAAAPAVLHLRTLSLLDGGSNVVLSTSLPK